MNNLFVLRGKMQEIYARHSKVVDKVIQFVLVLTAFFLINNNIGFMKVLAQPVITLVLAIACTFFPLIITVLAAAALVLCHFYSVSIGIMAVTGAIFMVMFAFYFRLTPKKAVVVLLTPVAFMLNIPHVIPITCALVTEPMTVVAVVFGTIVFYMLEYVKLAVPTLQGDEAAGMMTQITAYVKQVFQNKQMWVVIVAFIICYLLVYAIRRCAMDHAWKVAIAVGTVVNIIVITAGNIVLGEHTKYGSLIGGSMVAIIVGIILEFFIFSVDYSRSENLQFEDDDYYYYVKAVPKMTVSIQEKTIKRINERYEVDIEETPEDIDEMLLAQSLREELK